MANDNQTALMMSMRRKKDKLDELWNGPVQPWTERIRGQIDLLRDEIAEDEKLLVVDREQLKNAFSDGVVFMTEDRFPTEEIKMEWYTRKYGTDGK